MLWIHGFAAFLISVLSGMGVGGGGLLVIYLAFLTDLPQLTVQGINLLFFLFSAGAATLVHLQRRRILWGSVAILAGFGVLGVLLGTHLAASIDERLLRRIFGGLLVLSGILSLKRQQKNSEISK